MSYIGVANNGELLYSTPGSGIYNFGELTGDVEGTIDTTLVTALRGYPLATGAPLVDQVIKWNGSEWTYQPDASGSTEMHALLGVYHSDVTPSAAVRGDIIVAQGTGTPLWTALSIGTQGFVLYSDGQDAVYTRLGQNTPFESGTAGAPAVTFVDDLDTGWFSAGADQLGGSAGGVELIRLDGVDGQVQFSAGQVHKTRSGGSTTLLDDDYIYMVTSTPATVVLPSGAEEGQTVVIKDRDGNATGANPVIIDGTGADTIDGNATILIRNKYGSFTLVWSGTEWHVI